MRQWECATYRSRVITEPTSSLLPVRRCHSSARVCVAGLRGCVFQHTTSGSSGSTEGGSVSAPSRLTCRQSDRRHGLRLRPRPMRAERRLQRLLLCNVQEDQSGQSDCLPPNWRVANERQIKEIATQHGIKGKKHFFFLKNPQINGPVILFVPPDKQRHTNQELLFKALPSSVVTPFRRDGQR